MADVAISTDGLTRVFGTQVALSALSIEVPRGEVLALLGPNGAGKTTTVRLLNAVLAPDAGSMRVLGIDPLVDPDELRRHTGVLTEHAGLDDRLTATENLLAVARIRGMDTAVARRRIGELLERFGMSARADQRVAGASTGQRKRIALARSLLHDPEVLFLDEPTSGLDPAAIRDVVAMIDSLAAEQGRTVILCTHFLGEADELADRMAMLHHGHLEAFGRPAELAAQLWNGIPATLEVGGIDLPAAADLVLSIRGVLDVTLDGASLALSIVDREVLARAVSELVRAGADVFAARPETHTLSDVYFEVERRRADDGTTAMGSAVNAGAADAGTASGMRPISPAPPPPPPPPAPRSPETQAQP